jgi:hypothetical protein
MREGSPGGHGRPAEWARTEPGRRQPRPPTIRTRLMDVRHRGCLPLLARRRRIRIVIESVAYSEGDTLAFGDKRVERRLGGAASKDCCK